MSTQSRYIDVPLTFLDEVGYPQALEIAKEGPFYGAPDNATLYRNYMRLLRDHEEEHRCWWQAVDLREQATHERWTYVWEEA